MSYKGKTPYQYPPWVREKRDPPEEIQRQLRAARERIVLENSKISDDPRLC